MYRIRIYVLITLFLISCNSPTDPEIAELAEPFFSIEDDFHMDIFERSSSDSASNSYFRHELQLITADIYPCCNFSIIVNESLGSNGIELEIDSIYIPSVCLTALGPASYREKIKLEKNSSTMLSFINGNVFNKFSVDVSDSLINIAPIEDSYIKVSENFILDLK